MFTRHIFSKSWCAALGKTSLTLAFLAAAFPALAQITISGVTDKSTYTGSATFTVATQAGYNYSATLNGAPVPVGTAVRVQRMDYYELCAARTNISVPTDFATNMIRFIVVASDRGSPEKGLIKWTPYPLINSTAAEWTGAHLEIMTPRQYPMNLPIPLIARAEDAQGNERRANGWVKASNLPNTPIKLLRGHGSSFLPPATSSGTLTYNGQLHAMQSTKTISVEPSTTWITAGGVLSADTVWGENTRIHITSHLTIPAGVTLTIDPAVIVKLNPLVNITNTGTVIINGSLDEPVVFTSTNIVYPERNAGAWGGFLLRGSSARLIANGTIFAGGGGATSFSFSPGASHRSEQAVFLIHSGATFALTNCAVINTHGQVANGYASEITFDHCLCQRAITCGEYSGGGTVTFNHCAVIEFPEDNGIVNAGIADADYDGIYFTEGTHIILNSLVGFAMDDALDSGSGDAGTMMVSNCWVEAALHEAHAWSGGGRKTWTYDTVLMNSGQGLECGWSTGSDSPIVVAERMLSTANSVGTRIGDNYDWSYNGWLRVTNCMVLYNYRDLFLKTWNGVGSGWQTNSWVDRVAQAQFGANLFTTTDPRFPSNLQYEPAEHGVQLAQWLSPLVPLDAPVGIGLALRTNFLPLGEITNDIPVRLSTFSTHPVSVDYVVLGSSGPISSGALQFAAGETLKFIPALAPGNNQQITVVLKNPVQGELTSIAQAWYCNFEVSGGLVSQGSAWRYLDTGEDAGIEWRNLNYSDNTWSNGVAQLGFGDNDETTPIRRYSAAGPAITTYYFRQKFVVSDPSAYATLAMWLLRDDGGVVYLNGTEVFRSPSMPAPPTTITFQTWADAQGSAPGDNTIDTATLSPSLLVAGTNIVAVEIHQFNATSSDLSFDFSLTGNYGAAGGAPTIQSSPADQAVAPGGTAVFTVQAAGPTPLVYQWWYNQTQLLDAIGPVLTISNVGPANAGTYHAVAINPYGSATSQAATLSLLSADTDSDGMPDDWERDHGLNVGVNDADLDLDNDGMSNLNEYIAGTDPQNPNSYLNVQVTSGGPAGMVTLSFIARVGKTYEILYTDSLAPVNWQSLTNIAAPVATQVFTMDDQLPQGQSQRYYRLRTPAP